MRESVSTLTSGVQDGWEFSINKDSILGNLKKKENGSRTLTLTQKAGDGGATGMSTDPLSLECPLWPDKEYQVKNRK